MEGLMTMMLIDVDQDLLHEAAVALAEPGSSAVVKCSPATCSGGGAGASARVARAAPTTLWRGRVRPNHSRQAGSL